MVTTTLPCGTGSNYNDGGDRVWASATNIQVDDGNYASSAMSAGEDSMALYAQNFGFAIPSSATITNVSFSYIRYTSSPVVRENIIAMLDGDGTPSATNNASLFVGFDTSDETITKSGDSAYWGLTLTPTLVNDTSFGLKIKANAGNTATAYVQYVSCTVTYTLPQAPRVAYYSTMMNR